MLFEWLFFEVQKHLRMCKTYSLVFQSDITDINEIFRDLGMMVHEQGDMIGKIR